MLMKRIEYKTKFYLAVAIFLFISIVAFLGPVSKTIEVKERKNEMQKELSRLSNAPERIFAVKKQISRLDEVIGFKDSIDFNQSTLFLEISGLAAIHQVSVREVPRRHLHIDDALVIETNIFKFEGDFINIVKMLDDIEDSFNNFSVVSIEFYRIEDRRSKKTKLLADFFIRGIRKN